MISAFRCRTERYLLVLLFLVGVFHWLAFFYLAHPLGNESSFIPNLERPASLVISKTFTAHDWYKEVPYHALLKEALLTRTVPFHVPQLGILNVVKDRFLGALVYPFSPQLLLLYGLSPFTFIVINVLILYVIGFYGCMRIRQQYQLGMIPFTFLFLVFNFNGYFIEKMSAYGAGQLGYFLLPFFLWFVLKEGETMERMERREISNGVWLGLVLAAILYQGSLHLFVELITFVILWGIVNWKKWRFTISALFSAFLVGAMRVLPAAVTFGAEPTQHGLIAHGYPLRHPLIFLRALVETTTQLSEPYPFAWWEFSLYISWIGFGLILFFAFWVYVKKDAWVRFLSWRSISIPLLFITIISFGPLKRFLIPNFIPLLNGESLTSRYMIIPLLFATVIAAVNMEGFLRSTRYKKVSVTLGSGLLLVLAGFLFNHSRLWRMHLIQNEYDWVVAHGIVDASWERVVLTIQNHSGDTLYVASFWIGVLVSVIAIFVVAWLLRKVKATQNLL